MLDKDYIEMIDRLTDWIKEKVEGAGCEGVVVGLSGGIDSAVTATLCKKAFPDNTVGIIMPCYSNPKDEDDAKKLAKKIGIEYKIIDLGSSFDRLVDLFGAGDEVEANLSLANIKPRLRMTTLYYFASQRNSLVVGTDNRSELKVGYFTKYGDGGIDITPLGNLVKTEVREIARLLEVPVQIIEKDPSAGLWSGQTDEDEMGVTYQELDRYILTGEAQPRVKEIVDSLSAKSSHKLKTPPIPQF